MTSRMPRGSVQRVLPFAAFMVVLALRGAIGGDAGAWLYALQAGLAAALLAWWWRDYAELGAGSALSLRAWVLSAAVGLAVLGLWLVLDARWMRLGEPGAVFAPVDAQGELRWGLIAIRWIGAALVVPVMEELFWRGFLMRWVEKTDFLSVDPRSVGVFAIVASSAVFALAHTLWLAALIAGLAYAWLYRACGTLWAPVVAHAVTNGLLGAWVVSGGRWQYW
jgi:uncharacterized protein